VRAYPFTHEQVQQALLTAGTVAGAARLLGVSHTVVEHRMRKWGLYVPDSAAPTIAQAAPPEATEMSESEREAWAFALLQARGYRLDTDSFRVTDAEFQADTTTWDGTAFRVGVVSDTHLCSKEQQLTFLHDAYAYFEREGIDLVLHPGDLHAGNGKVYRGQIYDMFIHGFDERVEYVIEYYPRVEGVTTKLIAGNHDLADLKESGHDFCRAVCDRRPDLHYLGQRGAYVIVHGVRFYLMHPDGGVPYARSYRLQKVIEQFAPEAKPNVLLMGHLHVVDVLPKYRNVTGLICGCFEAQTSYLKAKGLNPEIGFWVLDVTANDQGIASVKIEWFPVYVPKEKDW